MVGWNPTLRSASKIAKGDAGIWQRRFWEHLIRDEADWRAHVAYCRGNPVKHGLVARAVDWPYSSIHRDIRAGRVGPEWAGAVTDGDFGEWGGRFAHRVRDRRPRTDGPWQGEWWADCPPYGLLKGFRAAFFARKRVPRYRDGVSQRIGARLRDG